MIYFVTGTDTGVGKTHVTASIVRALRSSGRSARAVKPIETGWNEDDSDASRLAAASARSLHDTVYLRFDLPRSPLAAASAEGRTIDVDLVARWCREQDDDPLLVEGAGGWMVPIHRTERMSDLAIGIGAPVIVVGRAGLGTINHCLLTVEAVRSRASVSGVILSRRPADDLDFARENAREIESQLSVRVALAPDDLPAILAWF